MTLFKMAVERQVLMQNTMYYCYLQNMYHDSVILLSGVPDYFGRNKISSGGDLSHYSSASLY